MTKFLLLFLVGSVHIAHCQNLPAAATDRQPYLDNSRQFIHFYREMTHTTDSIRLSDRAGGHIFAICEEDMVRDSFFTAKEKREIQFQLDHPLLNKWTPSLVEKARIIPRDSIDSIFKHYLRSGWDSFYVRYGRDYTSFSAPIFLRDDTLCLFYSMSACGGLCGEGRLRVFRKEGREWKLLREFCVWMS